MTTPTAPALAPTPALRPLDERDTTILNDRQDEYDKITGPRVGDYVIFADGTERRISHDWWGESFQTSEGGSFYLGSGYQSFSGSLYTSVPADSLTDTGEQRHGLVWFFHHGWHRAHNGVYALAVQRVYACSLPATR